MNKPDNYLEQYKSLIVGKTVQQAEMLTMAEVRPVVEDAEERIITLEYNPNRINVEVKDGRITKLVSVG